jgi:hypothetical protein
MPTFSLNGYNVNVQQYTVSKQAKLYIYSLPNSALDSLLPMGAQNRQHKLVINAISDTDAETIMNILTSNNIITLTDVEGNNHSVSLQNVQTTHIGGMKNYYIIEASFIEVNG